VYTSAAIGAVEVLSSRVIAADGRGEEHHHGRRQDASLPSAG